MKDPRKIGIGLMAGAAALTAATGAGAQTVYADEIPAETGTMEEALSAGGEPRDYYEAAEQEDAAKEACETAQAEMEEAENTLEEAENRLDETQEDIHSEEENYEAAKTFSDEQIEAAEEAVTQAEETVETAEEDIEKACREAEEAQHTAEEMPDVTDAEMAEAEGAADAAADEAAHAKESADAAKAAMEAEQARAEDAGRLVQDRAADVDAAKQAEAEAREALDEARKDAEAAEQEKTLAEEDLERKTDAQQGGSFATEEDVQAAKEEMDHAKTDMDRASAVLAGAQEAETDARAETDRLTAQESGAEQALNTAKEAEKKAENKAGMAGDALEAVQEELDLCRKVQAGEAGLEDSQEYKDMEAARAAYGQAEKAEAEAARAASAGAAEKAAAQKVLSKAETEAASLKQDHDVKKAAADAAAECFAQLKKDMVSAAQQTEKAAADVEKKQAEVQAAGEALRAAETAAEAEYARASSVKQKVEEARKNADARQAEYDTAYTQYLDGAYGFYDWLAEKYRDDDSVPFNLAEEVQEGYARSFYDKRVEAYQNRGSLYDSTSIPAVEASFQFLEECNRIRVEENGLPPLMISIEETMVAQASLNYALVAGYHSPICDGENLITFTTATPFQSWYYNEKRNLEENNGGKTGHYRNIVTKYTEKTEYKLPNGKVITDSSIGVTGYATTVIPAEETGVGRDLYCGHVQDFYTVQEGGSTIFTVSEYRDLFHEYVSTIGLEEKEAALKAARQALSDAQAELDACTGGAAAEVAKVKEAYDRAAAALEKAEQEYAEVKKAEDEAERAAAAGKTEAEKADGAAKAAGSAWEAAAAGAASAKQVFLQKEAEAGKLEKAHTAAVLEKENRGKEFHKAQDAYEKLITEGMDKKIARLSREVTEKEAALEEARAAQKDAEAARKTAASNLASAKRALTAAREDLAGKTAAREAAETGLYAASEAYREKESAYRDALGSYRLATDAARVIKEAEEALREAEGKYKKAQETVSIREQEAEEKSAATKQAEAELKKAEDALADAEIAVNKKVYIYCTAKDAAEAAGKDAGKARAALVELESRRASRAEAFKEADMAKERLETARAAKEKAEAALAEAKLRLEDERRCQKVNEDEHARMKKKLATSLADAEGAYDAARAVLDEKEGAYAKALADYNLAKEKTNSFLPLQYTAKALTAAIRHLDGKEAGFTTNSREGNICAVLVNGKTIGKDSYTYDAAEHMLRLARSYTDSLRAGIYNITMKFTLGSAQAKLAVNAADIRSASFSGLKDMKYTGQDITQVPSVTYNGKKLTAGKDFTATFRNNRKAGTATVIIEGIGSFKNKKELTFRITSAEKAVYRLYNKRSGGHFYTTNAAERDACIKAGWTYEGVNSMQPESAGTPVYRMYNMSSGEHFYTMDVRERDNLIKAGWRYEGVAFRSAPSTGGPVYRLYNPNAKGSGQHHFTASRNEYNNLVKAGWHGEGVAWFTN